MVSETGLKISRKMCLTFVPSSEEAIHAGHILGPRDVWDMSQERIFGISSQSLRYLPEPFLCRPNLRNRRLFCVE